MTVREGYLLKRKEEPASLATRFAFKKRYFWLSGETLSYAKSPDGQVGLPSTMEALPVAAPHRVASAPERTLRPIMGKDLPKAPEQLGKFPFSGQALLTPRCEGPGQGQASTYTHSPANALQNVRSPQTYPPRCGRAAMTMLKHLFPARSLPTYHGHSRQMLTERSMPGCRAHTSGIRSLPFIP